MVSGSSGATPYGPGGSDIGLEILRRKLVAIAGEMSVQLRQTAQISEINAERDYAVAIVDRNGAVVSTDNPLQLGALSGTAHAVLKHFKFDMKEGDVIVTNAPDFGGTRAVDLSLISPLFVSNSVVLYFTVRARMPDIGGMIAGGFYPTAGELFGEGVPITPLKLHREGRAVRDIVSTVLLNSRHPDSMKLTLDAMLASMDMGARRVRELISTYNLERICAALDYTQRYVERRTRAQIASWTDGTYYGEAHLDHDGAGGAPVAVRLAATIKGDELTLDFGASDAQVPSFINSTLSNTIGSVAVAVLAALGDDVPANEGLLRAVRVICDSGKVTNASVTAATGWSTVHCGSEITEATARALRGAASLKHGDLTTPQTLLFARPPDDRGARLGLDSWSIVGSSAVDGLDGWGRPAVASRAILPSVEEWEISRNIRILRLEFAGDSSGCGEWRGAPAVEVAIELPEDYVYTICRQGARFTPQGVLGGGAGSSSKLVTARAAEPEVDAPVVAVEQRLPGNILRLRPGGGAGYGDPQKRDPQAVAADVLDGLVSKAAAESVYGVVFTGDGRSVDASATTALRARQGT